MSDQGRWWQSFDWPGAVALVLALGISGSLFGAILALSLRGQSIGEFGANMLSTVFGATIGAIATYLGQASEQRRTARNNNRAKMDLENGTK
jgi:hypothetical protein